MNDAAIRATVGADLGPLRQAGIEAEGLAGDIGDKIEHRLFGARHLAGALATALGLNLDKIGEQVARIFTDMSKETEEAMKKAGEISDETAAITAKMLADRRNDEQKMEALVKDKNDLLIQQQAVYDGIAARQKRMDDAEAEAAKAFKAENRGEEMQKTQRIAVANAEERARLDEIHNNMQANQAALDAADLKIKEQIGVQEQRQFESALRLLPAKEKILALAQREYDLQLAVDNFQGEGVEKQILVNNLKATQHAVDENWFKTAEENAKKQAEYDKQSIAAAEAIDKLKFDQMPIDQQLAQYANVIAFLEQEIADTKTTQEQRTADQLELEKNRAAVVKLIADKEREIKDHMVTVQKHEANVAAANQDVNDSLDRQIQKSNAIIALMKEEGASEEALTAEIAKQTALINAQVSGRKELMDLAQTDELIIGGKSYGAARNPEQIANASTKELQELIRRARIEVRTIKDSEGTGPTAGVDAATGYIVQESAIAREQTDIQRALYQLSIRDSVQRATAFGGEDLARQKFTGDPLQFDAFFQKYTQDQTKLDKTNELLTQLNQKFDTGKAKVGTISLDN